MLSLLTLALLAQINSPNGTQPGDLDGGALVLGGITRCRNCHDRDITAEPTLYTPFDGWVSTMMANAVRDPLFRAALTVANQDAPGIGSWCLRCHSPAGWVQGNVTPDGAALYGPDLEGITCEACHRSIVPDGGVPLLGNAQLTWEYGNDKYGPYENISSPAHEGSPSSFTGSSELCGQCHQVQNPIGPWRSADGGILAANFPLDTTYEEWKQSGFARDPKDAGFMSCADCHMARFNPDGGGFLVGKLGPERLAPRRHILVGGNLWGLKAVQAANPNLAQWAEQFAETEALVKQTLAAAAKVELVLPTVPVTASVTKVKVKVKNLTGHKLPSGYADGRRVVVQLKLDGVPVRGIFDGGALVDEAQARVYEILHGKVGVGPEEHLALHDTVVKDSRIPPRGFVATNATRPYGVDWFDLPDGGFSNEDSVDLDVQLPDTATDGQSLQIEAVLLFQATTPHYVQFLAQENRTDDAGRVLLDAWRATGEGAPVELSRASGSITVSRPTDAGGGSGGGGGSGVVPGPCGCSTGGQLSLFALLVFALTQRARRRVR
jgi:hypothetical protein